MTEKTSSKFSKSISLLAWGLNEEALVEGFLDRAIALLDACVEDFEIVFVDDGSTDRMPEILASYAAREPRLRVLTNHVNRNVGYSCRRAIKAATKDYLFWQTVDWSYDISELRIFLELLNHYDVVQGVRPTPIRLLSYIPLIRSIYRVKSRSDNWIKAIISLSNYYMLRILYGLPFHDFQNVTLYPTHLIQLQDLSGDSSFLNPECLFRTYQTGARFIEVPIPFVPRSGGVAKGTHPKSILRSIKDILRHWLRWGWRFRLSLVGQDARIHRISNPMLLDEAVLRLTLPLFKYFR